MRKFRFLENMREEERDLLKYNGSSYPDCVSPGIIDKDSLEFLIYAPDPITGVPRSDLPLLLNEGTRPEVQQYIRNTLLTSLPSTSRTDDPDLAIDMLKSRNENFEVYANRLRLLCSKSE